MCDRLADIEQITVDRLGEKKGHQFVLIIDDWLAINGAIFDSYRHDELNNLVLLTFWGVFKELTWFHFLFVSGNYPLLKSRLRFVWESMFRARYAQTYSGPQMPGPSPDDKVAWLEAQERHLRWSNCIEPVLRELFTLADRDQEVRDHYHERWNELHRYVHPSAYLAGRMIGDSALHFTDKFDEGWALDTIAAATDVFDLVWLTVLKTFPKAGDRLFEQKLSADYPILNLAFEKALDR
jgi:hypothetical protein